MSQINIPPPKADTAEEWSKYIALLHNNQANRERKRQSKEVVDYYNNKQRGYLESEFNYMYSDALSRQTKRKSTLNIFRPIIDSLAQVYNSRVERDIKGKKRVMTRIEQPLFSSMDKDMSKLEKHLEYEKSVLVGVEWNKKRKIIKYKSYSQYEFDVVIDNINTRNLMAVILSDYKDTSFETYKPDLENNRRTVVYTPTDTWEFLGTKLIRNSNHNLNFLPYVLVHAKDPGFEDYLDPDLELAKQNLEVNVMLSHLLNICATQAHGILHITLPAEQTIIGTDDSNSNIPDSNTLVELDNRLDIHDTGKAVIVDRFGGPDANQRPEIETIQYDADIEGVRTTIMSMISNIGRSYDVEIGQMDVSVTAQPQTATSIWVTENKRQNIIKEKKNLFIESEREIFTIAYRMFRLMFALDLPEELDSNLLNITYTSETTLLESAAIGDLISLKNNQLLSSRDIIERLFPLLGDQEITDKLSEIKELNQIEQIKTPNNENNGNNLLKTST